MYIRTYACIHVTYVYNADGKQTVKRQKLFLIEPRTQCIYIHIRTCASMHGLQVIGGIPSLSTNAYVLKPYVCAMYIHMYYTYVHTFTCTYVHVRTYVYYTCTLYIHNVCTSVCRGLRSVYVNCRWLHMIFSCQC